MTTLLLIRHGETPWNVLAKVQGCQNIALSETGKAQASLLSERLNGAFTAVYTSPLHRAFETAEIICKPTQLSPIPLEALKEVDFGSWEGLTFKEISKLYPTHFNTWLTDELTGPMYDGDGSIQNVSRRAKACIYSIVQKHPNETIVMVSHGGLIKSALIGLFDWKMNMYHHFALGNTCITTIRFDEAQRPMLVSLNDTTHLNTPVTAV
ncbi:histidine phosphatase family protein [Cellulosilyticum sp. WCF-2]|uniref:histidine phosphatase family protein n=1 Tax=Cellulosilyticum sp. WCF-2 TaxID=2497860 RepID=UPI000F8E9A21|nr:histidine phosphatase family protein [Cellulosilyticum sp. WCF-2]QEH68553.1 histidine phosphatase family protein [Cellulosilyticum sp. WCF-2]